MGERDVATNESDQLGAKLGAMVLVDTKKMSHLVEQ